MLYWISRFAKLLSLLVFFILFITGSNPEDFFGETFVPALLKAFIGGALFWVFGFVVGDIILKGAVEDVPKDSIDILDGGIVQRLYETKSKHIFKNENSTEEMEENSDSESKTKKN